MEIHDTTDIVPPPHSLSAVSMTIGTETCVCVQYSRTYFDIHLFRQVYKSAIFFLMFLALNSTFTYFDICWNKLVKILFFSMFYQYSDTNSYIFSDFFPSFSRTYFDIHLFRQISPKFLSSLISTCRNKCESTVRANQL